MTQKALRSGVMALVATMGWMVSAGAAEAGAAEVPAQPASDAAAAFERLKTLSGEWHAEVTHTHREGTQHKRVSYYLTGGGEALVEHYGDSSRVGMSTVYHLDGPELVATHYCGMKNQPRFKAAPSGVDGTAFDFAFVDATNLSVSGAGNYTHRIQLELLSDHRATLRYFTLWRGEEMVMTLNLVRQLESEL